MYYPTYSEFGGVPLLLDKPPMGSSNSEESFPPAQFDANSTKASVKKPRRIPRYIQMSQRTCRVFPTFPRSFLCLNKFWISYLFKETKAKGKGHPSLSSLAPCPERSKTRTNAAELWCSTMPLMCTKQLRSKKSCKLQKCHCLPKSQLMSSSLGQAGVVIFWSSFFLPSI